MSKHRGFEEAILPKQPHLQIGLTSTHGEITTFAAASVFALGNYLSALHIKHKFLFIDGLDEAENLNKIANQVYRDPDITHLLLVDRDLHFDPASVMKLLKKNLAFVCGRIPVKTLDLYEIFGKIDRGLSYSQVHESSWDDMAKDMVYEKTSMERLGFSLIHRNVLSRMVEKSVVVKYIEEDDYEEDDKFRPPRKTMYGFFSFIYNESNRDQLQTHEAFCYRWRRLCGGEILVTDNLNLAVSGALLFSARFADLRSLTP